MTLPVAAEIHLPGGYVVAAPGAPAEPYPGLEPFRFTDSGILAGRDGEIERLVRLITMYRGVLLYGESGAGKSSLVNAGLLPRILEDGYWPHRVRVQPRAGQELILEPLRVSATSGELLPSAFGGTADDGRLVLAADAFADAASRASEQARLLLVFDQFEELVTLFEGDADGIAAQARVIEALVRLLRDQRVRVKLLFAFREDYLAALDPLLSEHPELADQSLRLVSPPVTGASRIIRAPFEAYRGSFERELSPELAERVEASLARRSRGGVLNLSELQVVCRRLWEDEDPAALLEAEGVEGLLEDFLEGRLRTFGGPSGDVAVAILTRLVTESGTRNVVSRQDVLEHAEEETGCSAERAEAVLRRLESKSHLVRSERRRDVVTYEIVSEFLVPRIAVRKAERMAAAESARALADAEDKHQHEIARRNRLVLRIGGAAALVALAVIGVLAVFALGQRNEAQHAAKAIKLASFADSAAENDPRLAATLALMGLDTRWTAQGESTLRTAFVAQQTPTVLTAGSGHAARPNSCCVSFSRDGTVAVAAVAALGAEVRAWNVRTGNVLAAIKSARGSTDPQITGDGRTLIARDLATGDLIVHDIASDKERRYAGASGFFVSTAISPTSGMIAEVGARVEHPNARTLTQRGFLLVRSLRDGRKVLEKRLTTPADTPRFSADGTTLIVHRPSGIEAWTIRSGKRAWRRAAPSTAVSSPDGRIVAVSSARSLLLVDAARGEEIRALRRPRGSLRRIEFAPGGKFLAAEIVQGGRRTFSVWSVDGGARRVVDVRRGSTPGATFADDDGTSEPDDFAVSPGGVFIAIAKAGDVLLFHVDSGLPLAPLRDETGVATGGPTAGSAAAGPVRTSLKFSPDGALLATAATDAPVRLWNLARTVGPQVVERDQKQSTWTTAFSPHSDLLAIGDISGRVTVSAVRSRREIFRHDLPGSVVMVAFSRDGRLLAAASDAGHVSVWRASDGTLVSTLRAPDSMASVDFSPDGRRILGTVGSTPVMWRVSDGKQIASFKADPDFAVEDAVFSRDGRRVAAGGDDGVVRVWDAATRRKLRQFDTSGAGAAGVVAFSRDGRNLAAGTESGAVIVWDTQTGQRRGVLRASNGAGASTEPTWMVLFTADSRHILSAGDDGKVRLWDWQPQTDAVVATFTGLSQSVALSPDRRWLSAGGANHTTVLIRCQACAPLEQLKADARAASRPLTREQQRRYLPKHEPKGPY